MKRAKYGDMKVFRGINSGTRAIDMSFKSMVWFSFHREKFQYITTKKGYSKEEVIEVYNKKCSDKNNPIERRIQYSCISNLETYDILKEVRALCSLGIKDILIEDIEALIKPRMEVQLSIETMNNISYDGLEKFLYNKVCSIMNELFFLSEELGLTLGVIINNDVYSIHDFLYTDIIFVREKGNNSHFAGYRYQFPKNGE